MTCRTCLLIALSLFFIGGCSSIYKQGTFHECKQANCALCKGTGFQPSQYCQGSGQIRCRSCRGMKHITCTECNGLGQKAGLICSKCNGQRNFKCTTCGANGTTICKKCNGAGKRPCGKTTYSWVCRDCGKKFDYPAKRCPACNKK